MTKLSQIIDAATSDTVATASLLRMVKVVASRLDTAPLTQWVDRELEGYEDDAELPRYRGPFPASVMGHFVGPYRSEMTIPIPAVALQAHMRGGFAFTIVFQQPVSELEPLAAAQGNLQNRWDADAVAQINYKVHQGELKLVPMHQLVEAYKVVTPHQVRGVLDAVRTRVLNLALDLEKVAPEAGEPDAALVDAATVQYVVNNNVYGDGNALATGSPGATQTTSVVKHGDLAGLLEAAAAAGLPAEEVGLLEAAVRQDADVASAHGGAPSEAPGPRVSEYMGKLALGAGGVTGKVAIGAAGGTLAGLIRAFYGLG